MYESPANNSVGTSVANPYATGNPFYPLFPTSFVATISTCWPCSNGDFVQLFMATNQRGSNNTPVSVNTFTHAPSYGAAAVTPGGAYAHMTGYLVGLL
jgi:hypothetical protein